MFLFDQSFAEKATDQVSPKFCFPIPVVRKVPLQTPDSRDHRLNGLDMDFADGTTDYRDFKWISRIILLTDHSSLIIHLHTGNKRK